MENKEITEHIIEIGALAAILLIGWMIGLPLRRRARKMSSPLGVLLEPLATPLVVLALSGVLHLISEQLPKLSALGNDKLLKTWLAVFPSIEAASGLNILHISGISNLKVGAITAGATAILNIIIKKVTSEKLIKK